MAMGDIEGAESFGGGRQLRESQQVEGAARGFVEERVIYVGAEARVSVGFWHGLRTVRKLRLPKAYRVEPLDQALRARRTTHEAQLLHDSKRAGVPAPTVFLLDTREATLLTSYVEGERLRERLLQSSRQGSISYGAHVGRLVGQLHGAGIIHGDLTTSNMIVAGDGRIFLVDFGLGAYSPESEDRGVDLLLMKRALNSTHYRIAAECYGAFVEGYKAQLGRQEATGAIRKAGEIERRGRYVERTLRS